MGVHTGEPLVGPAGPFGTAVVVAARLCELAGAGQLLASDVVRAMLEPRRSFEITSVGPRRLKGFPDPVICHLIRRLATSGSCPGLPTELSARRDAPFVGRGVDLDILRTAFIEAGETGAKMALVAGATGAGKTRLVQEFAAEAHQQGARVVYGCGAAGLDIVVSELQTAHRGRDHAPIVAVIDDVGDRQTTTEIHDALRAHLSAHVLVIVVTELAGVGLEASDVAVIQLAGLPRDQMVRTPVGAIRDELRVAIVEAAAVRVEEERSLAAVTSGLLELTRDSGSTSTASWATPELAPYKGLVAYGTGDGRWFCGRDALTAELVANLAISRFIAITGSSGWRQVLAHPRRPRRRSGKRCDRRQRLVARARAHTARHPSDRVGTGSRCIRAG